MIADLTKKLAKELTSLDIKKYRDETGLFIVEGEKFVGEIPEDWDVACYVISGGFAGNSEPVRDYEKRAPVYFAPDGLFHRISGTVSPQGVLAVCRKKPRALGDMDMSGNGFFVYCDGVSDPGNAGTLLRTADAACAAGFALSEDSADIYGPKTIRSCAGSVFHLPVVTEVGRAALLDFLRANGIGLVAADPRGKTAVCDADIGGRCCIAVGNEARGLSDVILRAADVLAFIPMPGKAESLNASVAGGVIMYEAVRQRIKRR
ncbi:MAG: RNA methyltransferase [Firmicutes bacterium]|nr:RNA methyltransferase [Bacillota bacterium]